MSPEQAEGKQIDHRSDIFSIGIILYEMATGERPFKGDTAASLISSILRDTPQSAAELNPGLPRDLGKIVRRCLAKDPARRYQSALDIRNELEELKEEVNSGEVLYAAATPRRARSWKWIFLAGVTTAVIAVVVYWLVGARFEGPSAVQTTGTFSQITSQPALEIPRVSRTGWGPYRLRQQ